MTAKGHCPQLDKSCRSGMISDAKMLLRFNAGVIHTQFMICEANLTASTVFYSSADAPLDSYYHSSNHFTLNMEMFIKKE